MEARPSSPVAAVRRRQLRRFVRWFAIGAVLCALSAGADALDSETATVEQFIATIVREAAAACPRAALTDQIALERCRASLYGNSALRNGLAPVVLWGRPHPEGRRLRDTPLTQLAPDVISALYAPLFMFTGDYELSFDTTEGLYRARVVALFRNGLDLGQYPYPFWHDARKWADYQAANQLTFWIDPSKVKTIVMQFSADGALAPRVTAAPRTPPPFDGKWMWTDATGQMQPRPTLFVGVLRSANPHLADVERAFRDLAAELRKATCHGCHAPDNPVAMTRLVLMQTPAHAAGEITRIMRSVRDEKMPLDEAGLFKPLDPAAKATLLQYGAAFESVLDAARRWERNTPRVPRFLVDVSPPWEGEDP